MITPEASARERVVSLAHDHGIRSVPDHYVSLADDFARLSGDTVIFDETELLLIALGKAGVVNGVDLTVLHVRYLEELRDGA